MVQIGAGPISLRPISIHGSLHSPTDCPRAGSEGLMMLVQDPLSDLWLRCTPFRPRSPSYAALFSDFPGLLHLSLESIHPNVLVHLAVRTPWHDYHPLGDHGCSYLPHRIQCPLAWLQGGFSGS